MSGDDNYVSVCLSVRPSICLSAHMFVSWHLNVNRLFDAFLWQKANIYRQIQYMYNHKSIWLCVLLNNYKLNLCLDIREVHRKWNRFERHNVSYIKISIPLNNNQISLISQNFCKIFFKLFLLPSHFNSFQLIS